MKKRMKEYTCQHCGVKASVDWWTELNSMHLFGKWVYVRCPFCGRKSWKRIRKVKKDECK